METKTVKHTPTPKPDTSEIDNEISDLLIKKEKLWTDQMASYDIGTATRKRTTSRNARISQINDRIFELRKLKKGILDKYYKTIAQAEAPR